MPASSKKSSTLHLAEKKIAVGRAVEKAEMRSRKGGNASDGEAKNSHDDQEAKHGAMDVDIGDTENGTETAAAASAGPQVSPAFPCAPVAPGQDASDTVASARSGLWFRSMNCKRLMLGRIKYGHVNEHPYKGCTPQVGKEKVVSFGALKLFFTNLELSQIEETVARYPARGDPWKVLMDLWEMNAAREGA